MHASSVNASHLSKTSTCKPNRDGRVWATDKVKSEGLYEFYIKHRKCGGGKMSKLDVQVDYYENPAASA